MPSYSPLSAHAPAGLVVTLLFGAACDPQASNQYRGEPLLSMSGRVELTLERDDSEELRPALAFRNHDSELHIIDVEVSGEFPAGFTLDVYDAPPREAFVPLFEHLPDEPRVTIGYITAVTEDHPSVLRFGQDIEGGDTACASEPCATSSYTTWCTHNEEHCYTETTVCPYEGAPAEECTTTGEGDASLKQDPWDYFAGLSENYLLVYLEEPAPAGGGAASMLASREEGLSAGYHLFEIGADRGDEQDSCNAQARDLALERFNEQHGTDFADGQLYIDCEATAPPCDMNGGNCLPTPDCPENAVETYHTLIEQIRIELDCPMSSKVITRVEDPSAERVSVRIGPDLRPAL